ncbi:DNA segregation ATPase FtsK/SpoIIIE [Methylacidimicrobium sp. AP8]|uniref:FtsK/SpoIIIE family DNA translocase n=1 Tax=Methylacidimicrobium sp. AP8 TaxID=2730359 RepID=UPI0018C0BB5A|nr:DNA translocase FtsK [Methylacidimicrobium sp. AP8]CAB4242681.1 DNA segregation ATPase FtsK/SpoIIIE [Methylacidimicrobium sp. AP8]
MKLWERAKSRLLTEVGSVFCFGLALILLLSLVSYQPRDIAFNQWPSQPEVGNAIGPMGAYTAFALYSLFGLGAYLIPFLLLTAGMAFSLQVRVAWSRKLLWTALFLIAASAFFNVQPYFGSGFRSWVNIGSTGGFVGELLDRPLLTPALGKTGSQIFLGIACLLLLIILYETEPIRSLLRLARWAKERWAGYQEKRLRREGVLGRIEIARRKLAEEERLLAQELSQKVSTKKENRSENRREAAPPEIVDTADRARLHTPPPAALEPGLRPVSDFLRPAAPPAGGSAGYCPPPLRLLRESPAPRKGGPGDNDLRTTGELLVKTLGSFGIESTLGTITKGPTVIRFELYPAEGVRVDRILSLQRDIARATRAEKINILAPIPGKDSVGVEIPNPNKSAVVLRDILGLPEFQQSRARLPIALGKDVYGQPLIADLAEMPHLLIAGATGSGKSVCINSLLLSLLFRFGPEELRLILVDPKQVELQIYNGIPHLIVPVVVDPKKVITALKWVILEMEKRYKLLASAGVRNIAAYNAQARKALSARRPPPAASPPPLGTEAAEEETPRPLPAIVVIVDELADLMQTASADVEVAIARLSAKARAAGIHLIVATQTPRREVVTGVIKANIPCRIAFQVSSSLDSRVILDENGAENLLGKGDFLYLPPGVGQMVRGQGAYVSEEEVAEVVDYVRAQGGATIENELHEQLAGDPAGGDLSAADRELVQKCLEIIWQERRASTSLLQRRLRLGYNRAAWVMDLLHQRGLVGPENGAKPREILADLDGPVPVA